MEDREIVGSMAVISDAGEPLDARVSIREIDGDTGLVLAGRGRDIYTDYNKALMVILKRLQKSGVPEFRAFLVSSTALKWDKENRILRIAGDSRIRLANRDVEKLRRELGRAMAQLKENPSATGGNPTKRIMLVAKISEAQWLAVIRGEMGDILQTEDEIEREAGDIFDPETANLAKERAMKAIAVRRGQAAFRKELMRAYQGQCAVTGCRVASVLEAAHIVPYQGAETNHVTNGLLLRADVHTLFDLGLIGIDRDYFVQVDESLAGSEYGEYHGQQIHLPKKDVERPSREALKSRPLPKCGK